MNRKAYFFMIVMGSLLAVSIVFHFMQAVKAKEYQRQIEQIDREFAAGIGRIAYGIEEGKKPGLIALEYASVISSLSEYTTFANRNPSVEFYAHDMAYQIKYVMLREGKIVHAEEIDRKLLELSGDPTNVELAEEIIRLIKNATGAYSE